MTEDSASDKTPLGLKQTVVGKTKQVAGALTGNESLAREGSLEQEQARQARKADTLSRMAEAESEEAVEQLGAVREAGQHEREALQYRTEAAESQAEREARVRKQAAELECQEIVVREQLEAARETTTAEQQARSDEKAQVKKVAAADEDHLGAPRDAERTSHEVEVERREVEVLDRTLTDDPDR